MNETSNLRERFAHAIERLDGDFELLCDMAALTIPDCPDVMAQIEASFQAENSEAAASALHKLKGMLSTYDSDGVVLEIGEMLALARRNQLKEAAAMYHQELPKIRSLIKEIQGLCK